MTDLEFLERLRRELSESTAWADIRGVVAPAHDPALSGNELLVFPAVTERTEDRVSIFRVLVEWEVGPDRHFPATERRSDRDRIESIVALAAELHDLMLTDPRGADANWPVGYRYHAFGGFPGWWCYLALCGEAFSRLPVAPDDWISESLVRDIEQRYLERHFSRPKLKHLTQIAIDEISVGKGHRYVTVVLDLESGAIVYVGEGKGGEALTRFWRRVRGSGDRWRCGRARVRTPVRTGADSGCSARAGRSRSLTQQREALRSTAHAPSSPGGRRRRRPPGARTLPVMTSVLTELPKTDSSRTALCGGGACRLVARDPLCSDVSAIRLGIAGDVLAGPLATPSALHYGQPGGPRAVTLTATVARSGGNKSRNRRLRCVRATPVGRVIGIPEVTGSDPT